MDNTIYTERKLFSSREVPWAKLGTVIDHPVTAEEAIKLGGLDFEISLYQAGWTQTKGKNWKQAKGRVAIVREDTGTFFQFASNDYTPVQYGQAFSFLNAISPEFVAAGALQDGRQGFVVVKFHNVDKLNLTLNGTPDTFDYYCVIRTSQNLSRGIEISLLTLRNRCMNQLTLPSFTNGARQSWSIRHSPNVHKRMHEAQEVLTGAHTYADEFARIAARLADIDVSWDDAKRTLETVLPNRPRKPQQIEAILATYGQQDTNGFEGTGWGLVNGVNEYFGWTRPGKPQSDASRFNNALDGQTHKMTARTARILLAQAR